jgi:hypothetical protein
MEGNFSLYPLVTPGLVDSEAEATTGNTVTSFYHRVRSTDKSSIITKKTTRDGFATGSVCHLDHWAARIQLMVPVRHTFLAAFRF